MDGPLELKSKVKPPEPPDTPSKPQSLSKLRRWRLLGAIVGLTGGFVLWPISGPSELWRRVVAESYLRRRRRTVEDDPLVISRQLLNR